MAVVEEDVHGHEPSKAEKTEEHPKGYDVQCWGCTLWLVLPTYSPIFKCGWCGALTIHTSPSVVRSRWKTRLAKIRDRLLVITVLSIIVSIVCGGVWATFPVLFPSVSVGLILHSMITLFLAFNTLFNFCLSCYQLAGPPGKIAWGQGGFVPRGGLEGYSFCNHCKSPKPPEAHHCRTCRMCVLDMDHHCPFIGNCVGANNHRHFILFLLYTVMANLYVFVMGISAGLKVWPAVIGNNHILKRGPLHLPLGFAVGANVVASFLNNVLLSARALALIYLVVVSVAILTGVGLLLLQQIQLLYSGHTYLDSIQTSSNGKCKGRWDNLRRVFGNGHPIFWLLPLFNVCFESPPKKIHVK